MLYSNEFYRIELCNDLDISDVTKIYNSNATFLSSHMNQNSVSENWVREEQKEMSRVGFQRAKIIDIIENGTIGFIEYQLANEVYLSLLMLDGRMKGRGFGQKVYTLFEEHLVQHQCKSIRIDVVNNYKENVIGFWQKQGFSIEKEIVLEWNGKKSPAYLMRKEL